jgi:hypothetical protein
MADQTDPDLSRFRCAQNVMPAEPMIAVLVCLVMVQQPCTRRTGDRPPLTRATGDHERPEWCGS